MICFMVPGRPVPAVRMTRRSKHVNQAAQRYLAFKDCVGWAARTAMRQQHPLQTPCAVEIWAYISGGRPGDSDNIAKAILDGMNGIIYQDDTQVVDLIIHRRTGKPQRTEVQVWEAEEVI